MQEVKIRLRFNRECLGFAKKSVRNGQGVIYRMPRDGKGRVMFLPSWWKASFRYAAKVVGRGHEDVKKIAWDPIVDGHLAEWKRIVKPARGSRRARYALHEAFRPNAVIGINAVLPQGLSIDDFTELLATVGTYKGISPFQAEEETYGTFEVVSVMPTIRVRQKSQPTESLKPS